MGERKSAMENLVNPWLSRYVLMPYSGTGGFRFRMECVSGCLWKIGRAILCHAFRAQMIKSPWED